MQQKEAKFEQNIGKYIIDDPSISHLAAVPREWAKGMRETKICVFDSSSERKTIRKFNEAFLSGCVVASDIPTEFEELFSNVIIKLNASMTAEEIDSVLRQALERPDLLEQMAIEAFKRARSYFSCKRKVDKLLEAASRYMNGERGYWFPYGYSATCRSYATESKYYQENYPAWCVDKS